MPKRVEGLRRIRDLVARRHPEDGEAGFLFTCPNSSPGTAKGREGGLA